MPRPMPSAAPVTSTLRAIPWHGSQEPTRAGHEWPSPAALLPRLEGQRRRARGHVLDDVIGGDDPGRRDQVLLADAAWLGACATRPELPAVVEKLADHVFKWWETLFLHLVGVAIRR